MSFEYLRNHLLSHIFDSTRIRNKKLYMKCRTKLLEGIMEPDYLCNLKDYWLINHFELKFLYKNIQTPHQHHFISCRTPYGTVPIKIYLYCSVAATRSLIALIFFWVFVLEGFQTLEEPAGCHRQGQPDIYTFGCFFNCPKVAVFSLRKLELSPAYPKLLRSLSRIFYLSNLSNSSPCCPQSFPSLFPILIFHSSQLYLRVTSALLVSTSSSSSYFFPQWTLRCYWIMFVSDWIIWLF